MMKQRPRGDEVLDDKHRTDTAVVCLRRLAQLTYRYSLWNEGLKSVFTQQANRTDCRTKISKLYMKALGGAGVQPLNEVPESRSCLAL